MDKLGDLISRQKWLGPVDTVLSAVADTLFDRAAPAGQKLRNFFHGTWFGHPLHPALTDVPLGTWTAATVLDIFELTSGDETLAEGSDMAVAVGLIGAVAAALSGLNHWQGRRSAQYLSAPRDRIPAELQCAARPARRNTFPEGKKPDRRSAPDLRNDHLAIPGKHRHDRSLPRNDGAAETGDAGRNSGPDRSADPDGTAARERGPLRHAVICSGAL